MKALLFDFDGTLVDSFEATLRVVNRLAPAFGYRTLSAGEAAILRRRGAREILQIMGPGLRHLPRWITAVRGELATEVADLQPPVGLDPVLRSLAKRGLMLGIITSNSENNIRNFLSRQGWAPLFSHIEAGSNLFGKSRLIRRSLGKCGASAREAVYVGDEVRDVEAARRAGVTEVAVTWGFNQREAFTTVKPHHIIEHPEELLAFL